MDNVGDEEDDVIMNDKLPERSMNALEIIKHYGYPAEEYEVTTEDEYIITIHRIPHGTSGAGAEPRQPVIVQHGFLCCSAIWILCKQKQSLGFILADAGYDVWLTNYRGNSYGRKHVRLNPKRKAFWKFSFDEMGRYDLPAVIDFVLAKTGFSQTNYIGHSLGTTGVFVMLAERPEYNAKVRSVMAMAPVISLKHSTSLLLSMKPFIKGRYKLCGDFEIFKKGRFSRYMANASRRSCMNKICVGVSLKINGRGSDQLDKKRLPIYLSHAPDGSSAKTYVHGLQTRTSGFHRYDYGSSKNIRMYGQRSAPMYDMKNVTAPVAIFWSENDLLATPKDVDLLANQLSNLIVNYKVPDEKFNHQDFIWALESKSLLYDKVIEVMRNQWSDK